MRVLRFGRRYAAVVIAGGANDFDSVGAKSSGDNNLVIASLKENMNLYEFGATTGGKKLAAAILK